MQINIISPDSKLYSGDIHLVQLPGEGGSFEIMQHHAPLIATLAKGDIKVITKEGEELFFKTDGGVVEVKNNEVVLLTTKA